MKCQKILPARWALLLLAVLAASGSLAGAQTLFQEGFNFTSGSDLGNDGAWGGGSSATLTVGSGNLTYSGLPDLGGNDLIMSAGNAVANTNIFSTSAINSGSIYCSFLADCTAEGSGTAQLCVLGPANSKAAKPFSLEIYSKASGGGWVAGIIAVGVSGLQYESTVLNLNQTYLVVAEYNFSTFEDSLFVDPVPGAAEPATPDISQTGIVVASGIQDLGMNESGFTGNFLLDNYLVGQSWASVTTTSAPEPSTLALSAVGLLGLAVHFRRRR